MGNETNGLKVTLSLPDQLVPSLLHIGAQSITALSFENNASSSYGPADVLVSIPGLSLEPVRVTVPLLEPGRRVDREHIPFPLERLDPWRLAGLMSRGDGLPCTLEV